MSIVDGRELYWYDDAIYKIGFYNYYQNTVDPSPWSFVVCFLFSFILVLLLPRYLMLYRVLRKSECTREESSDVETSIICDSEEFVGSNVNVSDNDNENENGNDYSANNSINNSNNDISYRPPMDEGIIISSKEKVTENIYDSFAIPETSSSPTALSSSKQVSQSLCSKTVVHMTPSKGKKKKERLLHSLIQNSRSLGRSIRQIAQTSSDKNQNNVEAISSQSIIDDGILEHSTSTGYTNMKDDMDNNSNNNNNNNDNKCREPKSDERTLTSYKSDGMAEETNTLPLEDSLAVNPEIFYDELIGPEEATDISSRNSIFSETSNPFLMIRGDLQEFAKVGSPDDLFSIASDWEEDFDPISQSTFYYHPNTGVKTYGKPVDRSSDNIRPWYYFYCSSAFRRKLRKSARWDDEMKKLISLALPYTIHTLFVSLLGLLEVGIIGRLLGTTELSAYFVTEFAISFATMFFHGILASLKVLVSQAHGASNLKLAGTYVQLCIWTHHLFSIPLVLLGWNFFDGIVLRLGFDEETADSAEAYARFALLYEALGIYNGALNCVLDVAGFETYSAFSNGVRAFFSFLAVFTVCTYIDGAELWMIGAIHICINILFFLLNVLVITYNGWLNGYLRHITSKNPFNEWYPIKTLLKASLRLSSGRVIENCEWNILFVFAAIQGPAEVAIWGLVGMLWDFADDIVTAVSDASKVRIAYLLGSSLPEQAKYSSEKSLFMGVVVSILMSMSLGVLQSIIPRWMTNDLTLQRLLGEMIPMVCLAVVLLSFGSICWSILCAQGRAHLTTGVNALGSLLVALPLATISNFVFNFNLQGLMSCIIIGYATSGFFNSILMLSSNWTNISKKVRKRTKRIEEKLEITQSSSASGIERVSTDVIEAVSTEETVEESKRWWY